MCDFKTKEKCSLDRHTATLHIGLEKTFVCDVCEKTFKFKSALKRHKNLMHAIEKKYYKCDRCDFKATSTRGLTIHNNSIHLGLRPYKCDACGQSFTQQTHMRS